MEQQTSPGTVQSVSALHSWRPTLAGSQLFCAPDARLVTTQACPCAGSHVASLEQNCGHEGAGWQTLPPVP
jgi:hypothetical protein